MNKKENVLVTGGAGYIGSVLVPLLLEKGYAVTVFDSFMYQQTSLLDHIHNPDLKIIREDVRHTLPIKREVAKADWIIPLACLTGAPLCDQRPLEARQVNLDAIKTITRAINKKQRIIFPTTNSGYGLGQKNIYCTEKTRLAPISHYGRLKVLAEKEVLKAGGVTLRLATAFGISPRMRLDLLVNEFVHNALNHGHIVLFESHFKRNYIHVRDIARAFLHAMANYKKMRGQAYNVGLSDANLSKRELCEEIKKHIPKLVIIENEFGQDPDKRNYIVSNAKIESTGYRPRYGLQDGIAELIRGYQIIKDGKFSNI